MEATLTLTMGVDGRAPLMARSRAASADALVAAARDGDTQAFERLLRLHDDKMRGLAYRMVGSAAAMDDALQDAYVRAFRAIGRFRGDAAFSTWLHRIVATTCIDHLRRSGRRREDALPDEPGPPAGAPGDPVGDQVSRRRDLAHALDELPADQRAALVLVDGEGLSYEDAAGVLGVAAGTVSSRLTRARSAVRHYLDLPVPDAAHQTHDREGDAR